MQNLNISNLETYLSIIQYDARIVAGYGLVAEGLRDLGPNSTTKEHCY
jgi:hypothetical protein